LHGLAKMSFHVPPIYERPLGHPQETSVKDMFWFFMDTGLVLSDLWIFSEFWIWC